MNPKQPGDAGDSGTGNKGQHGGRTDVNWDEGRGREPYANQDDAQAGPPGGADEFPAGDRGDLSGRNQEQLEQVRKKP